MFFFKVISIDFNIINNILTDRKTDIKNNRYSKSLPLAKFYDERLVSYLEAI